ncbi:hypothetical protein QBC36DRAFT_184757 [Triangularia setosa]|uniref:P-loop containing nucleoside triphosphate hydrolase protein n=1 Tax=Triangularia setosa TaxID=2587417 RepID=A0AAN6W957_9PEZI|nr:hypothetical protein QBC36DRAFT_184757 [Podospora setosa]
MANLQVPSGETTSSTLDSVAAQDKSDHEDSSKLTDVNHQIVYEDDVLQTHLSLLDHHPELDELNEITTTPLFTEGVREYARGIAGYHAEKPFSQYGLLGGDLSQAETGAKFEDPRIFWNIAAPSSFFICGSQGSGKSHTLSCLLENVLVPCRANTLPRPLTGIIFHYDTFTSDSGGSPCEAAWLSSNTDIKVRVLCPPTNIQTMQKIYSRFPHITVEELRINEADLNTGRMLDLMAVSSIQGNLPLYLHVAQRILRDLRILQQATNSGFDYSAFKKAIDLEDLTEQQVAPLKQRLDTLESFMVHSQAKKYTMRNSQHSHMPIEKSKSQGTDWTPRSGQLTIVDLSCPCVTAEMACSLFNICLSLFLEQNADDVGRAIALDEAHKYMTGSAQCQTLTENLLSTIRLQRHLGARVIISTQEPTISPKLLDLCSVTIVHRFTSPDWLTALGKHLAGVQSGGRLVAEVTATTTTTTTTTQEDEDGEDAKQEGIALSLGGKGDVKLQLFLKIVRLKVGEALVFSPSAIVGVDKKKGEVRRLGGEMMKIRVRNRVTMDGGRSVMAG